MSLISNPICLLISPYLKKENKTTILKKINNQNINKQKHFSSKSDQHSKRFEIREQVLQTQPIPKPIPQDEPDSLTSSAMLLPTLDFAKRSSPSVTCSPSKDLKFQFLCSYLLKEGHTLNIYLYKTSLCCIFRLPNRPSGHRVVTEINCEHLLFFKQKWLEEAQQRASQPKAVFYFYTPS